MGFSPRFLVTTAPILQNNWDRVPTDSNVATAPHTHAGAHTHAHAGTRTTHTQVHAHTRARTWINRSVITFGSRCPWVSKTPRGLPALWSTVSWRFAPRVCVQRSCACIHWTKALQRKCVVKRRGERTTKRPAVSLAFWSWSTQQNIECKSQIRKHNVKKMGCAFWNWISQDSTV